MVSDGLLLGLDVGTTRIKAVVLDTAGAEHAAASVPTPFSTSAEGIDMTVADLGAALRAVIASVAPACEQLAAVGVTGIAESGAPMSAGPPTGRASRPSMPERSLAATGPIIAWHDGRGDETVASLERRFGPALAGWTGRKVRTVSSVAKLGWLIAHGLLVPDRWLGVPELALFLLSGAEATEHSLAARTGAYHVTERCFLPEVITHVLARPACDGLFPPVLSAGSAMGFVSAEASGRYGIPAGIPVTIAGHDHLAAAAGLGARPDDLLNSVGTAETLLRRLDTAPDVERALELDLAVTIWPGGDAWGVLASTTRSGLVIDALAAHLSLDPARLDTLAEVAGESGRKAGWQSGGGGPGGEVGSDERGGVPGGMVALGQGIEVPAGPPNEMWTGTLRVLARRTAAVAERVAALAGPHGRLVVFGGGSRSRAWLQAKAAEFVVPVLSCPVTEAAARGAALAGGSAAGWWTTAAAGPAPPLDASGSDSRAQA